MSLVNPQAANIERARFAALGVVINALDDARSCVWRERPQREPRRSACCRHQEHRPGGQKRGARYGEVDSCGQISQTYRASLARPTRDICRETMMSRPVVRIGGEWVA
jgi:hypothetical protein